MADIRIQFGQSITLDCLPTSAIHINELMTNDLLLHTVELIFFTLKRHLVAYHPPPSRYIVKGLINRKSLKEGTENASRLKLHIYKIIIEILSKLSKLSALPHLDVFLFLVFI